MSSQIYLNESINRYILREGFHEHEILADLRVRTAQMPNSQMQISPMQGQFMATLAMVASVRRYLEVGVFTGYSTLAMAMAMPADGQIVACDISPEWTSIAEGYWQRAGVSEKIDLQLAPALKTLNGLIAAGVEPFDMAFLDADKINQSHYFERALSLVRDGGLICIDNTLWSGRVADPACDDADTVAIRDLNAAILADDRVHSVLTPVGDGLTLAVKKTSL